ncbi:MAG: hypothetical protein IKA76_01235, partial [Clostridia bacterium]|nr:hypothetical protein [Clostridia bacterium]
AGSEKAPALPRFLTGIGLILFLLFSLWNSYSDFTVQMNAPDKLLFMIGCLFAMLFTVEELRVLFGATRSVLYFISIGGSLLFLSVATLPTLLAVLLGHMEAPSWILSHLILVGMLVYASLRMISLTRELPPVADVSEESLEDTETEEAAESDPDGE